MNIPPQPSWAPLGIASWHRDNYGAACEAIESQIENFDTIGKSHCAELGKVALYNALAEQASRNNKMEGLSLEDSEAAYRLRMGLCTPDEAIRFFHQQPNIDSMEIARLTHVGDWDTNDQIDKPVRLAIGSALDLDTKKLSTDSSYKIRTFGYYETTPDIAHIVRKRDIASHLAGSILTVVVTNILIDLHDNHADLRALRVALRQEAHRTKGVPDRKAQYGYLRDMLEDRVRTRVLDEKPPALIPLSTIYYITRPEARSSK